MPEYRCYMCGKVLNRTHINEERTAFVCPECNAETLLESQDYAKLGIKPPELPSHDLRLSGFRGDDD